MMETAALILQYRDDFSALEPVAGTRPLQRIIRTFKYAGIGRVVVAGDKKGLYDAMIKATRLEAEFIYPTSRARKESGYSINALEYLKGKCDRLFFAPAHFPLFDIPTVMDMNLSDAALAAPVFNGKRGYPMLVSADYIDELIGNGCNFESLFEANEWEGIEVSDEGVIADVTEPIDADRIAAGLSLYNDPRPGFKLTIRREASYYGPGVHELIRLVEETGSLKKAYLLMGMARSYAFDLVKECEAGLGFRVFDTNADHSGSVVTNEAREYAAKYKAFHEACVKSIDDHYMRYFG